jgi:hypothetical protein
MALTSVILLTLVSGVPSAPPGHALSGGDDESSRAVVCPPLPQPPTPGCIEPPPGGSFDSAVISAAGVEDFRRERGLPLPPPTPAAEILAARLRVADLSHALYHANIALAELLAARGRNANANSSAYTQ